MTNISIRWMIRRDMPEVLEIENACFPDTPWCEEDFLLCLRQRNCIEMIAEDGNHKVLGFMIYELNKFHLHILDIAVHPESQELGIGTTMINRLKDKLSVRRRKEIGIIVSEHNDGMHLFLQSCGFICNDVLRDHYDGGESGYQFVWKHEWAAVDAVSL